MGHDEEPVGLAPIERQALGRPIQGQPRAAEHEQVEVELARPPALPIASAERPLELLEGDQESRRPRRRIGPGGDVKGDDRVAERGLVDDPDRRRDVQPRHRVEPCPGQGRQRTDAGGERRGGGADVCPETDVRPDAPQVEPPSFPTLGS
jgi:hypothetical protein